MCKCKSGMGANCSKNVKFSSMFSFSLEGAH